jgi:hypothetical protein
VERRYKDLFESKMYQSFEENLNFFNYFNITPDDLENALKYIEKGYEDPIKLKKIVEDNINKTLDFLLHHTKDQNGKYTVPVQEKDLEMSKAYIVGMFFTAIRILSQELLYAWRRDTKTLAKIKTPVLDKEQANHYDINQYRHGLRTFLEGIILWFYQELSDSEAVQDIIINHDLYFDNGLFALGEYRNLFVWIWIWSQLRVVNDFYSYLSAKLPTEAHWPELTRNVLEPFVFYLDNEEKEFYKSIISERETMNLWKEDHIVDNFDEVYRNSLSKIKFNDEMTYEEYLKVVDIIGHTFEYYKGFLRTGFAEKLSESLQEKHRIVASESKLIQIIDSLTLETSWSSRSMESEFYELGLFQKPLLSFKNNEGGNVLVSYPEIILLSRRLQGLFDFPNAPTNKMIKDVMEPELRKFIQKEIEKTDKRYNVHYFKYKNNFQYELSGGKKKEIVTTFDQVMYDTTANYLFFCADFFFRREPILWNVWKNDTKMFTGDDSYVMRFVRRKIIPISENMKKIKKDFAIDDTTKITTVIFTNLELLHPPKFTWENITFFVINYAEVNYFLKTLVYKKGSSQYNFKFNIDVLGQKGKKKK